MKNCRTLRRAEMKATVLQAEVIYLKHARTYDAAKRASGPAYLKEAIRVRMEEKKTRWEALKAQFAEKYPPIKRPKAVDDPVNREGLTIAEWVAAAGLVGDTSTSRQAWLAGEDPTEWRAAQLAPPKKP